MFIGITETSRVENTKKTELSSGGTLFVLPLEELRDPGAKLRWINMKVELSTSGALIGILLAEDSVNGTPSEHKKLSYPRNSFWCTT